MKIPKTQLIRSHIARHPGATNREISLALGIPVDYVASATTHDFQDGKLVRRAIEHTPTKTRIYGYWMPGALKDAPPPPAELKAPVPAAEPAAAPKALVPEPPRRCRGIDDLITELAGAIALQVTARIRDRLVQELKALVPQADEADPVRPLLDDIKARMLENQLPERERCPVVVIIGLLPQQAGLIQNEFHDVFDLRFWKDEAPARLKDMMRNADHVLTFTSKIGHHVEEMVKAAGKTLTRVTGGMTTLRDALTTLYVEHST